MQLHLHVRDRNVYDHMYRICLNRHRTTFGGHPAQEAEELL